MLDKKTNTRSTVSLSWLALSLLLLIITGCGGDNGKENTNTRKVEKRSLLTNSHPMKVAVLQDKTDSANYTRTPQITSGQFDVLINHIRKEGGEVAFGLINEDSNASLHRLRIDLPNLQIPIAPSKEGNPYKVDQEWALYRKEKAEFDRSMQEWEASTGTLIARFKEEIAKHLDMDASANRSDVIGAIQRAEIFLAESDDSWPAPTRRYTIIISDGVDNVGKRISRLKSGAQLFIVNGSASMGSLPSLNPQAYENIDAAIRQVLAEETKVASLR